MAHVHLDLVLDQQRDMRAAAAQQREIRRANEHVRLSRRAERAERRTVSHAYEAQRLQAMIAAIEAGQ
jgi:hypothetical protein